MQDRIWKMLICLQNSKSHITLSTVFAGAKVAGRQAHKEITENSAV